MCEFCEGKKPVFSSDNIDSLRECEGIVVGNHQRLEISILGDNLNLSGSATYRTCNDAYYINANNNSFTSEKQYGTFIPIKETFKIKYCPICGRRLSGKDIDLININQELNNLESIYFYITPIVRIHKSDNSGIWLEVCCFESQKERDHYTERLFNLENHGYGYIRMSGEHERLDVITDPRHLPEFPFNDFINANGEIGHVGEIMRMSPTALLCLPDKYPLKMFDGYGYKLMDREIIKKLEKTYNKLKERIDELKERKVEIEMED